MAKYRHRTALRERLPLFIANLIPKGRKDCGEHEWYCKSGPEWRCYHCKPGVTYDMPFGDKEYESRRQEGEALLKRYSDGGRY